MFKNVKKMKDAPIIALIPQKINPKISKADAEPKEGLIILRDCLKISNYYIRYRDMSEVIRCNLLTQASRSTINKSWQ
jgi:hypothetical protein